MSKKELTNPQKDILVDILTKFCEYFEKKEKSNNEVDQAKRLLKLLDESSWVELDIYGKTIENAIISVVYKNGVQTKLNESNEEFVKEQFKKQDKYKQHFNEIFEYSDDTVFDAALGRYPIEHDEK